MREELQEVAAAFTIAALVVGIGLGSVISTPIVRML